MTHGIKKAVGCFYFRIRKPIFSTLTLNSGSIFLERYVACFVERMLIAIMPIMTPKRNRYLSNPSDSLTIGESLSIADLRLSDD